MISSVKFISQNYPLKIRTKLKILNQIRTFSQDGGEPRERGRIGVVWPLNQGFQPLIKMYVVEYHPQVFSRSKFKMAARRDFRT